MFYVPHGTVLRESRSANPSPLRIFSCLPVGPHSPMESQILVKLQGETEGKRFQYLSGP